MEKNKLKYHFALNSRNMIVGSDDTLLTSSKLDTIRKLSTPYDDFVEKSNSIEVIAIPDDFQAPDGYKIVPIRSMFAQIGYDNCFALARAKALVEWRRSTKYCGCCGSMLKDSETETSRICPQCGNQIFPRINPCVITLVSKGEKVLLARHSYRNQDIYACLAGYVEAGETIEQAVEREILEETGIRVKNVRYFASQSWPFPNQLMMGFTAEYDSGELKLQPDEIADAQWFGRDDCPITPQPGSLAYRLLHNC